MNGHGNGNGHSMGMVPESWHKPTRRTMNGHDVSSALEIAGDDMQFPQTGAIVRAVPLRNQNEFEYEDEYAFDHGPVSVPGDTFWQGARGYDDPHEDEEPPPDITLHCVDGEHKQDLHVTWDMSWSDVLDMLRAAFKRAVVFTYDNGEQEITVASEDEFDVFCLDAEKYGHKATIHIIDAKFTPSEFITGAPKKAKVYLEGQTRDGEPLLGHGAVHLEGLPDEPLEIKELTLWQRLDDSPYPIYHTIAFGGTGLLASIGAVVYGYLTDLNTLAAVALALPCNIFVLSFMVAAVEDGMLGLVKLGVGFVGFFCASIVIACYSLTNELIALASAFMFLLASFWYLEVSVKARGWGSWYTGLYNLYQWCAGGCPLEGIRVPEPLEDITLIGPEPKPTLFNAMQPVEQRHPGCKQWVPPKVGLKVKHVGTCMSVLSAKGNPMGPWEEGIMNKKLVRQLRKWMLRYGKMGPADFKKFSKLPKEGGTITYVGSIGTRVDWGPDVPAGYYKTGEDSVYELVLYQDDEPEAERNLYLDGQKIHSDSNRRLQLQTLAIYFLPRFCTFIWYWIAFFAYFLMLYTFEFSLTNFAVFQASGGLTYQMKGQLYNVGPGNSRNIHIYCMGPQYSSYDGRPPVIMESMETIGQGAAMARLQELVADRGVACVYDRIGFGFSSGVEVESNLFQNRTPDAITDELYFALMFGSDFDLEPVHWRRDMKNQNNETLIQKIPIRPPFVMLGHSAGGLYARLFASKYRNITTGLILVDPLPAVNGGIKSQQQKKLTPFLMTLCTRFLQPMGLIYTFLPTIVSSLFSDTTEFVLNNKTDGFPTNDFDQITSFMYRRQWCPAVLAEYRGLYSGEPAGIDVVAEADQRGYDLTTLIWIRDKDRLAQFDSNAPIYDWTPNVTSGRRLLASECEGCLTWNEVGRSMLPYFSTLWVNPFTAQPDIMKGEKKSCAANECSEYTPLENPAEVYDAVLDMWNSLPTPFRDEFPSYEWEMVLSGYIAILDNDNEKEQFKQDLATLLRHVKARDITIKEGPTQLDDDAPEGSDDLIRESPAQFYGFSGVNGISYQPYKNEGSLRIVVQFTGHKERAVGWAQDNLRGSEDTALDESAISRRTKFLHQWRVMSLTEYECIEQNVGPPQCSEVPIDLFTSIYSSPVYQCPQNTYKNDTRCVNCEITKTSRTGTETAAQCFSCEPQFGPDPVNPSVNRWRYFYLSCDESTDTSSCINCPAGCSECPEGTLASPGALGLADCVPISGFRVWIKGPAGTGKTSQAITPHRQGRPHHSEFQLPLFKSLIANITEVEIDRISINPGNPKDVWQYPESRCTELVGACVFEVGFVTTTPTALDLDLATRYLSGTECKTPEVGQTGSPECEDLPKDDNFAKRTAREKLFGAFEIVKIFNLVVTADNVGGCPGNRTNLQTTENVMDIFDPNYLTTYLCPSKFYRSGRVCQPCPDMTTSNAGSVGRSACRPFNTFILVGKDASLTYEARTNPALNGIKEAKPHAYFIHEDPAYYKIRGYALRPSEKRDPLDDESVDQIEVCEIGLNCFNSTAFRVQLADLLPGIEANEVRLLQPSSCPLAGISKSVSDVLPTLCGPWPGTPPTPDNVECVCGLVQQQRKCYFTYGAGTIGKNNKGAERIAPTTMKVARQETGRLIHELDGTVGICAHYSAEKIAPSFIYDPNAEKQCSPRDAEFRPTDPDSPCPSGDVVCEARSEGATLTSAGTMYWEDTVGMCNYEAEDWSACSNRTSSPLDLFFLVVTFHGETSSEQITSEDVILKASSGDPVKRQAFLKQYNIIQVLKTIDLPISSLERDALRMGRVNTCVCDDDACQRCITCQECAGAVPQIPLQHGSHIRAHFFHGSGLSLAVSDFHIFRIDVWTSAPSAGGVSPSFEGNVSFSFFDGSERVIPFSTMTYEIVDNQNVFYGSLYIHPIVTSYVNVRVTSSRVPSGQILSMEFYGQYMRNLWNSTAVNMFTPNYGASSGDAYVCPLTARRFNDSITQAQPMCPYGSGRKCFCIPCKYPEVNNPNDPDKCICPSCGDGRLHWQGREECDDSNGVSEDGCSEQCEIENLQLCEGPRDEITGVGLPIQSYASADKCLRLGSFWTPYGSGLFEPRYGTRAVIHNDALWVIAGIGHGNKKFFNDLWFDTTNGAACVALETEDSCTQSPPATSLPALEWGLATNNSYRSSYYPSSGASGTFYGPFPPRGYHEALTGTAGSPFEGYIWITGGLYRSGWQNGDSTCKTIGNTKECTLDSTYNDVWRTTGIPIGSIDSNFASWELVTSNAGWQARGMFGFLEHNSKLWVLGGLHVSLDANNDLTRIGLRDVWSSSDGATWTQVTAQAGWSLRSGLSATTFSFNDVEYMYVLGGRNEDQVSTYMNDVWRSTNGVQWTEVTPSAQWTGRWNARSTIYLDNIFFIGGQRCGTPHPTRAGVYESALECTRTNNYNTPFQYGDVWVSSDGGVNWEEATTSAGWAGRSGHAVVPFDTRERTGANANGRDNLWLIGGQDDFDTAHDTVFNSFRF